MLFSELYKITVNEVTFVGFRGGDRPNRPPGSAPVTTRHEIRFPCDSFNEGEHLFQFSRKERIILIEKRKMKISRFKT